MSENGFAVQVRVVFGDCDPAQIVYFPNFYRWFDQATHDLCAAAGYAVHDVRKQRGWIGYPIAEAGAKFIKPATFDDELTITTTIKEWRRKVFLLEHQVTCKGELLAQGWQTRFIGVKLEQQGGRLAALEIPDEFRQALDLVMVNAGN